MNLRDYLLLIRRRKWIGIVVLAAALGTSATLTSLATPLYVARSSLFVGFQQPESTIPGSEIFLISGNLDVAERLTKTYTQMIRSLPVAQEAVQLEELAVDPSYVLSRMSATQVPDTQLIEVVVVDADPVLASNIANAVAEAFTVISAQLTASEGTSPLVPVTVFERAFTPSAPFSPNASRNLALAGVLGVVAGLGLMFAAELLDVVVRGPEDVERLTHLPVVALIPRIIRSDLRPRAAAEPEQPARAVREPAS